MMNSRWRKTGLVMLAGLLLMGTLANVATAQRKVIILRPKLGGQSPAGGAAEPGAGTLLVARGGASSLASHVSPAALPDVLRGGNLADIFGPSGIYTPDQAPNGGIGWLLPAVQRNLSLPDLPSLRKLDTNTNASIAGQNIAISRDIISGVQRPIQLADVAATIDSIQAVSRGQYFINFRYTIYNKKLALPLRFQLYLEGDAHSSVCWVPWVHASGGATQAQGTVIAIMAGTSTPMIAVASKVGVTVVDGNGQNKGIFTQTTPYLFTKRYSDITRDDIAAYMGQAMYAHNALMIEAPPPKPTRIQPARRAPSTPSPVLGQKVKLGGASESAVILAKPGPLSPAILARPGLMTIALSPSSNLLRLQSEFLLEPALVFFKTNQGNYVKSLMRAEKTGENYNIALWDARCYAKNQSAFNSWPFMAGGAPSNTEWAQLFGRGGYITNTFNFDFDRDGENTSNADRDVWLENISGPATQRLRCENGAQLAY